MIASGRKSSEDVCVELNEDKKGRVERDEKKHVHGWTVTRSQERVARRKYIVRPAFWEF